MLFKRLSLVGIMLSISIFTFSSEGLAVRLGDLEKLRDTNVCIRGDLSESVLGASDLKDGVNIKGTSLRGADLRECGVPDDLEAYDADFKDVRWAEGQFESLCAKYPCFGVKGRIGSLAVGTELIRVENIFPGFREDLGERETGIEMFTSAYDLEMGDGAEQRKARRFYGQAYELGNKEAANNLGFMNEAGVGGERNIARAMAFYQKALPHPVAQMNLTRLMATELGLREEALTLGKLYEQDGEREELKCDRLLYEKWYRQAATLGSLEAIRKVISFPNPAPEWVEKLSEADLGYHLYAQSQDFLEGKGITEGIAEGYQNTEQSMKLLQRSAKAGYVQAAFELSAYLKEGILLARNHEYSLTFLKRAVQLGHSQGMINLAQLYRRGYYINGSTLLDPNREKALLLYQCALERAILLPEEKQGTIFRQVSRFLGYAYEVGEGVDQDRDKALEIYEITMSTDSKSLTSLLGLSRLLRAKGDFAHSFKYLQEAQEVKEDDLRVLYMMGQHHEKGWGTDIKLQEARIFYEKASALGHLSAKIKLSLWDRKRGVAHDLFEDRVIKTIGELPLSIHTAFTKSLQRVSQELKENYRIINSQGEVLHKLSEDYERTQEKVERKSEQTQEDPQRVNYAFIASDPYLTYYNRNIDEDVSDEDASQASLEQVVEAVRTSLSQQEAYVPEIGNDFDSIMATHIHGGASRRVQKRFIRLYKHFHATQEEGRFGLLLAQNMGRCRDGLGDYFTQLENQYIYNIEGDIPLGAKLGRVLLDYKEGFLNRYRNTLEGAHEEATEGQVLLRERMRLPLGLPGQFLNPRYPGIGAGMRAIYQPSRVMEIFLEGGNVRFERGDAHHIENFEAYSSTKMRYLLQEEISRSDQNLRDLGRQRYITSEQLSNYIKRDSFLEAEFYKAYDDMEENLYFDTNAQEADQLYRPKFYEYLLRKSGYLLG